MRNILPPKIPLLQCRNKDLFEAAHYGRVDEVRALINFGADVKLIANILISVLKTMEVIREKLLSLLQQKWDTLML